MGPIIQYLISATLIFFSILYLYYIKIYKKKKFFQKFPGPPKEFFYGNARQFKSRTAYINTLLEYAKEYGNYFYLKMGPFKHMLITSDPDFGNFVMSNPKSFKKTGQAKVLYPWLGNGLAFADGEQWRLHRKLLTPAFHFKILEGFVNSFESCGDILVKHLEKMHGNQNLDIYPYLSRCALDIISETAMGTKIDAQNDESSLYSKYAIDVCKIFTTKTISLLSSYEVLFRLTKAYQRQVEALKYLHGYVDSVIEKKFTELKKSKSDEDVGNQNKKQVFIDLVFDAVGREDISLKEVRDEVNTFMFAGHDTTAGASSFILYSLANDKSIQDKVLKEQNEIFGNVKNPKITYSDLQNMKYLECVIKETLRMYPPVPLMGREADEDVHYNGLIIPKGTLIYTFVRAIHMNPKYYSDPEKFDPGRFEGATNTDTDEKQQHIFIPFSVAPRNCIGQKFAMLEMKNVVSKVVRNFELSPAQPNYELDLTFEVTLRSLNGIKVGIKLRE